MIGQYDRERVESVCQSVFVGVEVGTFWEAVRDRQRGWRGEGMGWVLLVRGP